MWHSELTSENTGLTNEPWRVPVGLCLILQFGSECWRCKRVGRDLRDDLAAAQGALEGAALVPLGANQ